MQAVEKNIALILIGIVTGLLIALLLKHGCNNDRVFVKERRIISTHG